MSDPLTVLKALRRPRMLIRAARFGLTDYRRDRDLARLVKSARLPAPSQALDALLEEEQRIEQSRQDGTGTYSIARHVDILIALMAEARLLPRPVSTGH